MLRLNASPPVTLTGNNLTAPSNPYRPPSLALIAAKREALASALLRPYWPYAGSWCRPVTTRGGRCMPIAGMLRVRSIGEGAQLAIAGDGVGFRRRKGAGCSLS